MPDSRRGPGTGRSGRVGGGSRAGNARHAGPRGGHAAASSKRPRGGPHFAATVAASSAWALTTIQRKVKLMRFPHGTSDLGTECL